MKKKTEELLEILKNKNNIEQYFTENIDEIYPDSIPDVLRYFLVKKGVTKSEAIENSGIEKHYGYQIFHGDKKPSRDKLIMLCFGMKLNLCEAQSLLKKSGYSELYPRNRRDSVIIFCIQHKMKLMELNELLYEYNLPLFQ
jgi:hypothetical protein